MKKLIINNKNIYMKKNMMTKVMAIIALLGIILGVVSTGVLILYETIYAPQTQSTSIQKSEDIDISNFLKDLSGSVDNTGLTK